MRCFVLLLAAILAPAIVSAQDGLPFGQTFEVPIIVAGQPAVGQAVISAADTAEKPMLVFYVASDGKIGVLSYVIRRSDKTDPKPQPNPKPDPKPQPDPTPNPAKLAYVYLIHESKDADPKSAAIRNDKAWKDACGAWGVQWIVLDKDVAATKFPVATRLAVSKGLPAVVLMDAQGLPEVIKPETAAELLARIKKGVGQ